MKDCWLWARRHTNNGYPMWTTLIKGKRKLAHRVMWESINGVIPDNMEIDHLCFNTSCINPDHLELVTREENTRRKVKHRTACKWGHPYTDGVYWYQGHRYCKTCKRYSIRKERRLLLKQQ